MAHRDQCLLAQLLYHFSLRICMVVIVKNSSSNSSYILVEVFFLLCPGVLSWWRKGIRDRIDTVNSSS
jgi:hypothetical protein